MQQRTAKIGRNSLCPCGSGKKYKKCCFKQAINHTKVFSNKIKERYSDISDNFLQGEDNHIKMSEIILDFAGELLDTADSMKDKEAAIGIAILAWNLSLLDEDTCNQQLLNLPKETQIKEYKNAHKEMAALLKFLINKKNIEYPSINRFILDYEFMKLSKNEFNLNIASIVPGEELETSGI